MARPNDKHRVREHYDRVSPYYHALWGEHLHHGYWIRGDESKETAGCSSFSTSPSSHSTAPADSRCWLRLRREQHLSGEEVRRRSIIKDKSLRKVAAQNGSEFVHFLRAFKALRVGFSSGNFVYGLVVARQPRPHRRAASGRAASPFAFACETIRHLAGKQLDPEAVAVFLSIPEEIWPAIARNQQQVSGLPS